MDYTVSWDFFQVTVIFFLFGLAEDCLIPKRFIVLLSHNLSINYCFKKNSCDDDDFVEGFKSKWVVNIFPPKYI